MILIRKLPVIYSFFVKQVVEKRLSAKLVPEYLEDHTSIEELEKLRVNETYFIKRDKGSGRPTKRERRQIDKLNDLKE